MDGTRPVSKKFPRSQKLKDTCDMCSASKVRCGKEKPICNRCEQLGYPCFYSPARRMGRPHPPRRNSSQDETKVTTTGRQLPEQPQPLQSHTRRDSSGEPDSNSSLDERSSVFEHHIGQQRNQRREGSESDFRSDSLLTFSSSNTSLNAMRDFEDDTTMFDFDDPMMQHLQRSSSIIDMDGLYSQSMTRDGSGLRHHQPYPLSRNNSSNASTVDALSDMTTYGRSSSAVHNADSDCATVAINMLQQLNATATNLTGSNNSNHHLTKRPSNSNPLHAIEAPPLDALIKVVSMAIKRVSTILVCPCSQKTDVGLLAAAVCAAILDIYGIIFHNSTWSDSGNEKVTIMRVLVELPKVASLVMQFTRRYGRDGEDGEEADFLPGLLAASMKASLRGMTNEATNWLAQV